MPYVALEHLREGLLLFFSSLTVCSCTGIIGEPHPILNICSHTCQCIYMCRSDVYDTWGQVDLEDSEYTLLDCYILIVWFHLQPPGWQHQAVMKG